MIKEAIILAGGDGWRLKPDEWTPKPMLSLGKFTLLEYQLRRLIQHNFEHIIIASDKEYDVKPVFSNYIEWNVENHRGTGGAVTVASDKLRDKYFYLLNVDDIVFMNPLEFSLPETQCRMLVAKQRNPYGVVKLRQDLVLGFKEKPVMDDWCSAGHYVFKKHIVDKYFPSYGSLEDLVLPKLADDRILESSRLRGQWFTINTMKDYMNVKEALETV